MKCTISTDQRIINVLLLNAAFIDNLGLMHGKMGIAIYFFHLARQTGNAIYEDYAGELIDEIYEEITLETPLDFENGLAGIGWGIEYLAQNGFIEADTDEVLEDFDHKLFQKLIYDTPNAIGLLNGLAGIGAYFLKRVQSPCNNPDSIPMLTNNQALIHLIDELDRQLIVDQMFKSLNGETENSSNSQKQKHIQNDLYSASEKNISNLQTFKHSNPPAKQGFNLLWDYPVLIAFMAELHKLNIFNWKVEKILCRLLEPLQNKCNYPENQTCRLILAFALKYLLSKTNVDGNNEAQTIQTNAFKQLIESASQWIDELLEDITREMLMAEILSQDTTLRYGTTGIVWLYGQLFLMTNSRQYQEEADWWKQKTYENNFPDNGIAGFTFQNEENAFGILEGLAGILIFYNLYYLSSWKV
jgi:lantibiotic modifying enzyme